MVVRSDSVCSRRELLALGAGALSTVLIPPRPLAAAPADWPCFRGPNRNGVIAEKLTLRAGGPRQVWTGQVGHGHGSMAVVGGRLFVVAGGPQNNLVCLDARTGQKVWSQTVPIHHGNSTPAVEGGKVYLLGSLDVWPPNSIANAYCFDASTGKELWKRDLPPPEGVREYGHAGSPVVWEDLVLFNAGGGVALKKATGEPAWSHAGFAGLATPVLFQRQGRMAVAIFGGDKLIARDARSGQQLWSIPWKTQLAVNACDPVLFDNKVFICSDYGRGRALYDVSAQPRMIWEFPERSGHAYSSGFAHQARLYGFTATQFVELDPASGQPRWEAPGSGSVLLIGDRLIRVREQGEIFIGTLSPTGFQATVTADAGLRNLKGVPAYWDGKLFVRSEQGQIACVEVGTST
jgi:outer membrane protein assembly factor BamB